MRKKFPTHSAVALITLIILFENRVPTLGTCDCEAWLDMHTGTGTVIKDCALCGYLRHPPHISIACLNGIIKKKLLGNTVLTLWLVVNEVWLTVQTNGLVKKNHNIYRHDHGESRKEGNSGKVLYYKLSCLTLSGQTIVKYMYCKNDICAMICGKTRRRV